MRNEDSTCLLVGEVRQGDIVLAGVRCQPEDGPARKTPVVEEEISQTCEFVRRVKNRKSKKGWVKKGRNVL